MANCARYIAGPQPDGTEGVAEVTFTDESKRELKKLFGPVIRLSKSDLSHRNLLGCSHKGKYFVLIPRLEKNITPGETTPANIKVSLHRFTGKIPKTFTVTYSQTMENQRENSIFHVLPCDSPENQFPEGKDFKSFESSSFLRKRSSDLLVCKDLNQILKKPQGTSSGSTNEVTKFKLITVESSNPSAKFQYFYVENSKRTTHVTVTVSELNKLEKCGILLIQHKEKRKKVVGLYEKEENQLRIRTFLDSEIVIDVEQTSGTTSTTAATTTTTAAGISSGTTSTTAATCDNTGMLTRTNAFGVSFKAHESSEHICTIDNSEITVALPNSTTAFSCSSSSFTTESCPIVSMEAHEHAKIKVEVKDSTVTLRSNRTMINGSQSRSTSTSTSGTPSPTKTIATTTATAPSLLTRTISTAAATSKTTGLLSGSYTDGISIEAYEHSEINFNIDSSKVTLTNTDSCPVISMEARGHSTINTSIKNSNVTVQGAEPPYRTVTPVNQSHGTPTTSGFTVAAASVLDKAVSSTASTSTERSLHSEEESKRMDKMAPLDPPELRGTRTFVEPREGRSTEEEDGKQDYSRCLYCLLDIANEKLREFFKKMWPTVHERLKGTRREWSDTQSDAACLRELIGKPKFPSHNFDSGDTKEWDLTILSNILKNGTLKFVRPQSAESLALKTLINFRNNIAHWPSPKFVSRSHYSKILKQISPALKVFGATQEDFMKCRLQAVMENHGRD